MPRVHRVFPYRSDATDTEPGGPLFVPAVQGAGRLDNPEQYRVLYVGADPDGAVGEAFGDHRIWTTELLAGAPALPGSVTALASTSCGPRSWTSTSQPLWSHGNCARPGSCLGTAR
jgi:hypothetical protein